MKIEKCRDNKGSYLLLSIENKKRSQVPIAEIRLMPGWIDNKRICNEMVLSLFPDKKQDVNK